MVFASYAAFVSVLLSIIFVKATEAGQVCGGYHDVIPALENFYNVGTAKVLYVGSIVQLSVMSVFGGVLLYMYPIKD